MSNNSLRNVTGIVRSAANQQPLSRLLVVAFDCELRSEQALNDLPAVSDREGKYSIAYDPQRLLRPEKGAADIRIKVFRMDDQALQSPVAVSEIRFQAPARLEHFDVALPASYTPPTEWEEMLLDTAALRQRTGLAPSEWEEDEQHHDLRYIAGETGRGHALVRSFALAHRLAIRTKLPAEAWYALLRNEAVGKPTGKAANAGLEAVCRQVLSALPQLDADQARRTVERSIKNGQIAMVTEETVGQWVERWGRLGVEVMERENHLPRQIADAAGLSAAKRKAFMPLFQQHRQQFGEGLRTALAGDANFSEKEISKIEVATKAANLTDNHFEMLRQLGKDALDLRGLAQKSPEEWEELLQSVPKKRMAESSELTSNSISGEAVAKRFGMAYPTAAFAGALSRRLGRKERNASAEGGFALQHADKILTFLQENPDFDLLDHRTTVEAALAASTKSSGKRSAADPPADEGFKDELKAVQRVFRLNPDFDATVELLGEGLHSAQQIYMLGEQQFTERFAERPGFSEQRAQDTWRKAAQLHDNIVHWLGVSRSEGNAQLVKALRAPVNSGAAQSRGALPNYQELFYGPADICMCEHCRSVYSPAAYLADVILFLKNRFTNGKPAWDVLRERRPDIGYLEFSCDNTNVALPYIDLVNEVLEAEVATGEFPLTLRPAQSEAFRTAVQDSIQVELAPDFSVNNIWQHIPGIQEGKWIVRDNHHTLNVRLGDTNNYFISQLPQTRGNAEDLAARPGYINSAAYTQLRQAIYPQSLPFDLYGEQLRAYLQKTGVARWELMQAVYPLQPVYQDSQEDIACEYFGISVEKTADSDEKRLILQRVPDDAQAAFWGATPDSKWLDDIAHVDIFLEKTGLEYQQMLALLDLEFIHSFKEKNLNLHIAYTDDEKKLEANEQPDYCSLSKQRIANLDAAALDRIHRFLRLWRKSDLKMWELDLLIRHPKFGSGGNDLAGESFLHRLMCGMEIKKMLGISVEQLCSLFGDIPSQSKFTQVGKERESSLFYQLFLNPRRFSPVDEGIAHVLQDGRIISIAAHKPALLAGLRVNAAQFDTLLNVVANWGNRIVLALSEISYLYRHLLLSKSLGISLDDWAKLVNLVTPEPLSDEHEYFIGYRDYLLIYAFSEPAEALTWLKKLKLLLQTGFTADELTFLLSTNRPLANHPASLEKNLPWFLELRNELRSIEAKYAPSTLPGMPAPLPDTPTAGQRKEYAEKLEPLAQLLRQALTSWLGRSESEANRLTDALLETLPLETNGGGFSSLSFLSQWLLRKRLAFFRTPEFSAPLVTEPVALEKIKLFRSLHERLTFFNETLRLRGVLQPEQAAFLRSLSAEETWLTALQTLQTANQSNANPTASLVSLPPAYSDYAQFMLLSDYLTWDKDARLLKSQVTLEQAEAAFLSGLSQDPAWAAAVQALQSVQENTELPARNNWLGDTDLQNFSADANFLQALERLYDWKNQKEGAGAITNQIARHLPAKNETRSVELLDTLPDGSLQEIVWQFRQLSETHGGHEEKAIVYFQGLFRLVFLAEKWNVGAAEMAWLQRQSWHYQGGWLNPGQWVQQTESGRVLHVDRLLNLFSLWQLQKKYSKPDSTFFGLLNRLNSAGQQFEQDAAFYSHIQVLCGWNAQAVERVAPRYLGILHFMKASAWQELENFFSFLKKINIGTELAQPADQSTYRPLLAQSIAQATVPDIDSANAIRLITSRYDEKQQNELNSEVQNRLRERKRDALVAWLLANRPGWEDANDLFSHFLIDVEMCGCFSTSRIVQAHGTVQMFVQRCLMGLEKDVNPQGDAAWEQWKWMKNYRVWEANRKVFLYPENWLEPELRRDKSPFFKDLESELLQSDLNKDAVETAFLHYVEQLDGVAHMEPMGHWYEEEKDILHVFARTSGEPHIYYYRQWKDNAYWTAWEKVDADILGDYLIPVVRNGQLYLYWPEFREEPEEVTEMRVPVGNNVASGGMFTPTPARVNLKVFMAVSRFVNGKWEVKKLSENALEMRNQQANEQEGKNKYLFFPVFDFFTGMSGSSDFSIFCYAPNEGNTFRWVGLFISGGCQNRLVAGFRNLFKLAERKSFSNVEYHRMLATESSSDMVEVLKYNENEGDSWQGFTVLGKSPGASFITESWQINSFDKVIYAVAEHFPNPSPLIIGTLAPWFIQFSGQSFFVLPTFLDNRQAVHYQKDFARQLSAYEAIRLLDKRLGERGISLEEYGVEVQKQYNILDEEYRKYPGMSVSQPKFHFRIFYHPLTCHFSQQLNMGGMDGLMSRSAQLAKKPFNFKETYAPDPVNVYPSDPTGNNPPEMYPVEDVDFTSDGAYSSYNWELFFHAPMLIAQRLSKDQHFEEAMRWFHYVFNPLGLENPGEESQQRYWITKPFYQRKWAGEPSSESYEGQAIQNWLRQLATLHLPSDSEDSYPKAVALWRKNPFDPHLIARFRTVAYQKGILMKYIDNLIAWGDQLFRRDTMESVNEATQLYVIAAEILGPRPRKVPQRFEARPLSFHEMEDKLDAFSNTLINLENLLPVVHGSDSPASGNEAPPASLSMLFFCLPPNEKLLEYWDTVADRLYKIRHCQNIEGVERMLALFAPPIDPGALIGALAGGGSLDSALADLGAPLPLYRFQVMLQKANELCNDLKALGGALLSALEKKDAEDMALLRQGQEIAMLEAVRGVKLLQIDEARKNLEGLRSNRLIVEERHSYYTEIERVIPGEQLQIDKLNYSRDFQRAAQGTSLAAKIILAIGDFAVGAAGVGGTPIASYNFGASSFGRATEAVAASFSYEADANTFDANMASIQASHDRRWEDWKLQERLAGKELAQIDKQIDAGQLRIRIAEKELANHDLQIKNAQAIDEYMRSKYTKKELYEWLSTQISQVYFQSYQLAFDLAKRAERCLQYELGLENTRIIQFGYWDSLHKGLMSAEKLQLDLRRLDLAYLERNKREFELTKAISLLRLDPMKLIELRESGKCNFVLPEELFDMDYPGHYFRRIKTVSLSIPCIAGPYTTVNCTLRLVKSTVRVQSSLNPDYARKMEEDDPRFRDAYAGMQSIATSNAQNDSGTFELNFRDERYLPFEGAGACSEWQLELLNDADADLAKRWRQFDYNTISDVILHLRYTAREGGNELRKAALGNLDTVFSSTADEQERKTFFRIFDIKQEFPEAFHLQQNGLEVVISKDRFPYFAQGSDVLLQKLMVFTDADSLLTSFQRNDQELSVETSPPKVGEMFQYDFEINAVLRLSPTETWRFNRTGNFQRVFVVAAFSLSTGR